MLKAVKSNESPGANPDKITLNLIEGVTAANNAFWETALPGIFKKTAKREEGRAHFEAQIIQTYSEMFTNHALAGKFVGNAHVHGELCQGIPYTGAFALYFTESAIVGYNKPLGKNENRTLYSNLLGRFNAYVKNNKGHELHNPPPPEELEKTRNWYLGRLEKNPLFTNTEIAENHVEQILYINASRDLA